MIEWLKTSLLGIIILGAFGSMLAIAILKAMDPLIHRIGPPILKRTLGRALLVMRAQKHFIDYLRSSKDSRELIVTCTVTLAFFGSWMVFMSLGFVGVIVMRVTHKNFDSSQLLSMILGWVVVFTCAFFAFNNLTLLVRIYNLHMEHAEAASIAQAKAEIEAGIDKRF